MNRRKLIRVSMEMEEGNVNLCSELEAALISTDGNTHTARFQDYRFNK